MVIVSIEETGSSSSLLAPSSRQQIPHHLIPTTDPRRRRSTRGRRKRLSRRGSGGGGGHTIKVAAILLSTALSMCWVVACLLVFRQETASPDHHATLHDLRHPLGNLRHDFLAYREGLRRKREVVAQNSVVQSKDVNSAESNIARPEMKPAVIGTGAPSTISKSQFDSPLIIFTFRRADYLKRTLTAVWNHHPANKSGEKKGEGGNMAYPIVISQDGDDAEVGEVIKEFSHMFAKVGVPVFHAKHPKPEDPKKKLRGADAYQALAVHFGWALKRLFSGDIYRQDETNMSNDRDLPLPQRAIILEEDIEIAPDFFAYLHATAPLLDSDPSLLAVSAFNDNGKKGIVGDVSRLVRSDFFPGLGWMICRRMWSELESKWPDGYWDDWLREPQQRKGRQIIRPEVSRTFHFGSDRGASYNQFGEALLDIELDTADFDWEKQDVSYLERNKFREAYYSNVLNAEFSTWKRAMQAVQTQDVRVEYNNWKQFKKNVPKMLPLMTDEKAGVPRTAFEAIVETRPYGPGGHLMFLTPPASKLRENLKNGKSMTMMDFSETLRVVPPPEKR